MISARKEQQSQWKDRQVRLRELNLSEVYCVLKAFLDESYDGEIMCVGGWIGTDNTWRQIEDGWLVEIGRERQHSIEQGQAPISRYHATDCANLKDEFGKSKGWDIPRQIELVKNLIKTLGASPLPLGVFSGLSMNQMKTARPDFDDKLIKQASYYLCMCECFNQIGETMNAEFPDEKVVVVYEHSKDFNAWAGAAYQGMKDSKFPYSHYFKGFTPGCWQDFTALQPSDLLAYEGFKATKLGKRKQEELRKSLQAVIGHGIDIRAGYFNDRGMSRLTEGFTKDGLS